MKNASGGRPPLPEPPSCRGRRGRLRRLPSGLDAGPGDPGKTDSDARAKPLLQDTPGLLSSLPFGVRQAWQGEADVPFRRGGPVGRPGEASPRPYAPGAGRLSSLWCRQAWVTDASAVRLVVAPDEDVDAVRLGHVHVAVGERRR